MAKEPTKFEQAIRKGLADRAAAERAAHEAMARIVAAVGLPFTPESGGINALHSELDAAIAVYRHNELVREKPSERSGRLKRAHAYADKLSAILETFAGEVESSRLRRWRSEVGELLAYLDETDNGQARLAQILGVGSGFSPFELLVRGLMHTFRNYFGVEPGYTRKDKTVRGPFIDFVDAILREFRVGTSELRYWPYERRAIAAAVTKTRGGKSRRK
jgi:hypothetical protein